MDRLLYLAKVVETADEDRSLARFTVELLGFPDKPVVRKVRMLSPAASADAGMVWLPNPGDEVVVAQMGGPGQWVSLGCVYNGSNAPPYSNDDGDNVERVMLTPGGSELRFDDTAGKESIRLATKGGSELLISEEGGSELISITSTKDVTIDAGGTGVLTVNAGTDCTVKAGGGVTVEATGQLEVKATAGLTLKSDATLDIEGLTVTVKADTALNLEGAVVTVKGNMIKLGR